MTRDISLLRTLQNETTISFNISALKLQTFWDIPLLFIKIPFLFRLGVNLGFFITLPFSFVDLGQKPETISGHVDY